MKKFGTLLVLGALLLSAVPAVANPYVGEVRVVNNPNPADRLNLRAEPSKDSASLGKYYSGTLVSIVETQGDWCKVVIDIGEVEATGYMMTDYLARDGEFYESALYSTFLVSDAILYPEPSGATAPLGELLQGTQAVVMGDIGDGWRHVYISPFAGFSGTAGFIETKHLEAVKMPRETGMRVAGYVVSVAREQSPEATNLYRFPSAESPTLIEANGLPAGGSSPLYGDLGEWYQVGETMGGTIGFVRSINREKYLLDDLFIDGSGLVLGEGVYTVGIDIEPALYTLEPSARLAAAVMRWGMDGTVRSLCQTSGKSTFYLPPGATVELDENSILTPLNPQTPSMDSYQGDGRFFVGVQLQGSNVYMLSQNEAERPAWYRVSNLLNDSRPGAEIARHEVIGGETYEIVLAPGEFIEIENCTIARREPLG